MADSELSDRLNRLLSDPNALAGLMNLAGSLMNGAGSSPGASPPGTAPMGTISSGASPGDTAGAWPAVPPPEILPPKNPPDLFRVPSADPRCELLRALKPYLSSRRAERVETMVKILTVLSLSGNGRGDL